MDLLIENPKDGTLLALIPEGEFLAGGSGSDEGGGKPFPVRLPAYYLALHPVTNAQYKRFKPDWKRNDGHPVVEVNWDDAQAYAKWVGLRLPTELEWEKGARGTDGREYPWGNQWDKAKCRNANNRGSEQTCGVWKYPEGSSPWGLYQIAGNVWEWCEDWYDSGAYTRYKSGNLALPATGGVRVVRGGRGAAAGPPTSGAPAATATGPITAAASAAFGAPGRYDYPLLFCPFTLCLRRCLPQAGDFFKWRPMAEELPVIAKAFDLAKEMTERTRKFPRDLRFVLGDRILATTYDVFDLLLEAKFSPSKRALLERANLLLERLRFQVRLCVEEKLMTVRQYEHIAGLIQETGRMVGGWRKAAKE